MILFLTTLFLLAIFPLKISGPKNNERTITASTEYEYVQNPFAFKNLSNTWFYTEPVSQCNAKIDYPRQANNPKPEVRETRQGDSLAIRIDTRENREIDLTPLEQRVKSENTPKIDSKSDFDHVDDGMILDYIQEKFGSETANALKVIQCESSGNIYAYNPETTAKAKEITKFSSCGLFQISALECIFEDNIWYDPIKNINRAYELYQKRKWQPWSNCAKKLNLL